MCLKILNVEETTPHIAMADMFVGKVLLSNQNGDYFSPCYSYQWRPGEQQPKVPIKVEKIIRTGFNAFVDAWRVDEGYHAYTPLFFNSCYPHCEHVYLMKIPKGTKYFLGIGDEIVAETMILCDGERIAFKEMAERLATCV